MSEEVRRQYIIGSEAWYSWQTDFMRGALEEITFGEYVYRDGHSDGCLWKAELRWIDLDGPTAKLEAFGEAWQGLVATCVLDVLASREDGASLSPETFCEILQSLGFTDATNRESPYSNSPYVQDSPWRELADRLADQLMVLGKDGGATMEDYRAARNAFAAAHPSARSLT